MSQTVQAYMKQEWDYYDLNLAKALEAVDQDDLYNASLYFQRIAWALRSLDKYHPLDRGEAGLGSINTVKERVNG